MADQTKIDALRKIANEKFDLSIAEDATIEEITNAMATHKATPAPAPVVELTKPQVVETLAPAPVVKTTATPNPGVTEDAVQKMIDTSLEKNNVSIQSMITTSVTTLGNQLATQLQESVSNGLGKLQAQKIEVVPSTAKVIDTPAPIVGIKSTAEITVDDEEIDAEIFTEVLLGGSSNVNTFKNSIQKTA